MTRNYDKEPLELDFSGLGSPVNGRAVQIHGSKTVRGLHNVFVFHRHGHRHKVYGPTDLPTAKRARDLARKTIDAACAIEGKERVHGR